METRLKKKEKFSCKLIENLNEVVNICLGTAVDYELSREQKLEYFHCVFEGEARLFYPRRVGTDIQSFAEACDMMK